MRIRSAPGAPLLFSTLLAIAAGCGQSEASPEEDAALERGRAHVEKKCTGCHAGAKLDAAVGRRHDPEDPKVLDGFLAGHYVEDAALRSDVVAYLISRLAPAPSE